MKNIYLCILFSAAVLIGCKDDPSNQYFNSNAESNGKCYGVMLAKFKAGQALSSSQSEFFSAVQPRSEKDLEKVTTCLKNKSLDLKTASGDDLEGCAAASISKGDADFFIASFKTYGLIMGSQDPEWALETNHGAYCAPIGLRQN